MYISAWEIHTRNLRNIIAKAVEARTIEESDIVWRGPSGDAVVAASPADLDEDYLDYVDSGSVEEYID